MLRYNLKILISNASTLNKKEIVNALINALPGGYTIIILLDILVWNLSTIFIHFMRICTSHVKVYVSFYLFIK